MGSAENQQPALRNGILHASIYPDRGLEPEKFREAFQNLMDRILDYHENVGKLQACPDVKPGFLRPLIPETAPEYPEEWSDVFADIDKILMKGMTHWLSTGFFAYYPMAFSYPAVLAEILSTSLTCQGFTWAASPSSTELETAMMDWLARALNLPEFFIHGGKGPGGGVIQGTASEATLVALLAARSKAIRERLSNDSSLSIYDLVGRMVAYTSACSHSSVEKAGIIAMIPMRHLDTDNEGSMRGETLLKAITEDKKVGKIPIYVCATTGTTSCCSFDNLREIGKICQEHNIWLHVDAAYAGSALLCPEFRHIADGLEYSTSFNFNPHKWMMVNFDCSAMWFRNSEDVVRSLSVDPLYLRHDSQSSAIDYRNWQIPLGRRFRSIKLWFVMRIVGLEGLRAHVRRDVAAAKYLESLVREDDRFEIVFPVTLGLVCIRLCHKDADLKINNDANKELYRKIQDDRRLHLTPSVVNGKYFIRVSMTSNNNNVASVENCWQIIKDIASQV